MSGQILMFCWRLLMRNLNRFEFSVISFGKKCVLEIVTCLWRALWLIPPIQLYYRHVDFVWHFHCTCTKLPLPLKPTLLWPMADQYESREHSHQSLIWVTQVGLQFHWNMIEPYSSFVKGIVHAVEINNPFSTWGPYWLVDWSSGQRLNIEPAR